MRMDEWTRETTKLSICEDPKRKCGTNSTIFTLISFQRGLFIHKPKQIRKTSLHPLLLTLNKLPQFIHCNWMSGAWTKEAKSVIERGEMFLFWNVSPLLRHMTNLDGIFCHSKQLVFAFLFRLRLPHPLLQYLSLCLGRPVITAQRWTHHAPLVFGWYSDLSCCLFSFCFFIL